MLRESRGTLAQGEAHPAAQDALAWLIEHVLSDLGRAAMAHEARASCAIESNRLAEVESETLHRLRVGLPCSDRYVLGLAWSLRAIFEAQRKG